VVHGECSNEGIYIKVFVPVFVFVPLYKSPWPFWGSRFERGVGLVSESCAGMDYYTLYIFNGYTLCKFTLTYTDYMYNILHNITTSEYITSIICITSLHVSIRLLCIVNYTTLC